MLNVLDWLDLIQCETTAPTNRATQTLNFFAQLGCAAMTAISIRIIFYGSLYLLIDVSYHLGFKDHVFANMGMDLFFYLTLTASIWPTYTINSFVSSSNPMDLINCLYFDVWQEISNPTTN